MKDRLKKAVFTFVQSNRTKKIAIGFLCVCLCLFFLYAALGFWVLPSYIQSRAQALAREKLQRTLVIEQIDFNPFSLTLDIKGVSLSEPGSEARFAAFEQLYAAVSPASVFRLTPVITEFKLVKPFVRVVRFEQGRRNFDDIVSLFSTQEGEKETKPEAEPERRPQNAAERRAAIRKRKFGIYNLQIVDARIELENREKGTQTLISDFHIGLPYLYRGPVRGIVRHVEPRFEAMVNGKRLEITRERPSAESRDSILRFNMDRIDLTRIFNYLPLNPAYRLREGWLDLHLSLYIHRPKEAQTSVDIGGQATLRSILMTRQDKPFFSMEKLDLHLGANSPDKGAYRIDRLEIVRPELHVASDKNGVPDIADLLAKADEEAALPEEEAALPTDSAKASGAPAAEAKSMTFTLKELLVKKARLRYEGYAGAALSGASLGDFDLVIQDAEMDFAAQKLKVGRIHSPGGRFDAALYSGAPSAAAVEDTGKEGQGAPGLAVQVGKFSLANWNGRIRHTASREMAAQPFSASINRFGMVVEEVSLDPAAEKVSVGEVQSSGASFDVTLEDHPAGKLSAPVKAAGTGAFEISIGKVGIAGWSARLTNRNREAAGLPVSAAVSQFGLKVEKALVDMKKQEASAAYIRSAGGRFDVLMENCPPVVSYGSAAAGKAGSPYHIRTGRLEVAGWSGKVKNSNRLDPFETPFSATFARMGVTVDDADIRLKDKAVSVAAIRSAGGEAEIELEPYPDKPSSRGKRAAARAGLLASVMEAQKAQPAEGFAVNIGKVAVSDWTARLKNRNTTDIAGMPVSGYASRVNLTASDIRLDTEKRSIAVGEIASKNGVLAGQIEKHEKTAGKKTAADSSPVVMPQAPPYAVHIGKLVLAGWTLKGRNTNLEKSLGVSVTDLGLTAQEVSFPSGSPARLSVRATVNKTGKLAADGKAGFSPLDVDMALDVKEVSLVAIQPYIDDYVNLTMNRADLSLAGQVRLKATPAGGLEGGYKGEAALSRLHTVDQVNKDTFVRWNTLALKEVDANVAPLSVRIGEAELNRFFARVILNPDGRLNLRNILRSRAGGQTSLTETENELDDLAAAGDGRQSRSGDKGNVTTRPVSPGAAVSGQAGLPLVTVNKLTLKKGRVRFTDNFIKPNYTANITEMEGTVTGFSSDPDAVARLDLRGQVNHAPLVAAGTISPLKEHLALDVEAQVRGMELAQFSSYTTRYLGYGIDKGKLSFDVTYKIEDGVLVAQNRLILDQLTFGEKAPGEPVTSLPVELAVSLLKDSNGVIDINLPVGGSLDDPSFSIGGILSQVFLSSLKRVILSPFAFLSIEFGKGAEMAWLDFEPGSAVIPDKETPKLEALAKAFASRPELKLDITGLYDSSADRAGLAKAVIKRKVRMLKRQDLQEKGQSVTINRLTVEDSEYPGLLERVYEEADIKKPRNLIGMQKKLTVPEMEALMEKYYQATEEEFLALAYQRAEQVKAWLVEKGKVADSRIFILASKVGESGENGETAARVDFAIQK
ncbi:MAG: DUF748 domain-containing protein [Oxalobacter formigenes]|nr:DUF748 domain-containing protein [Oxalobacter formigenes]